MVIINGKFLSQKITGVQRVSFEIVKRLDAETQFVKSQELAIIAPKTIQNNYTFKNLALIKTGKYSPMWEYSTLSYEVLKRKADVFSFSSGFPFFSKRGLYFMHDVTFLAFPNSFSFSFRIFYKYLFKYIEKLNRVKILTNSYFSKSEILKYYPRLKNRIKVVHLGHEHIFNVYPKADVISRYSLEPKSYFVSIATHAKHKNLDFLLSLSELRKDYKFVIIGRKPEKLAFKVEENSNKKINNNLIFTGYINDSEMVSLLKYSRGFISPSLYEGFGFPALEALSLNVPLILSDIPVFKELYDGIALFFNPHDPKELSKKLDKACPAPSEARKKLLSEYSWEQCINEIKTLWENEA